MKQAVFKPGWAWDVGLHGRPHDLGNISAYRGKSDRPGRTISAGWAELRSVDLVEGPGVDPRVWKGPIIIKGVLDAEDARDAVRFGADGMVVSNHGGRQLDGVLSTARALPAIAEAVGDLDDRAGRLRHAHGAGRGAHAGPRRRRSAAGPRLRLRPGGGGEAGVANVCWI
jgi:hypothetical protein